MGKTATKNNDTVEVKTDVIRRLLFGNSQLSGRSALMRASGVYNQFNGLRKIQEVAGYQANLTFNDFYAAYQRQDIASRVIETYPDYTWMATPEIYDSDRSVNTQFEKDISTLFKESNILGRLRSFDIAANIGQFALLVIGIDDGTPLHSPLHPSKTSHKLLYLRVYLEGEVTIKEWDTSASSPRYMQPTMYAVSPMESKGTGKALGIPTELQIHHSRCIHFADNSLNSDVYGVSRLQKVYDRMIDILKIVAGSGEMFWRGAYQGFAFEADAEGEFSDEEKTAMKDDIQKYLMGLDRAMLLKGVQAKALAPGISSPTDHLDAQLTMVSIASRIPKRILTGSEMGKLASTQDAENWAKQVQTRRANISEPKVLRPFIDFCIRNRVITPPAVPYSILWPALTIPSEKDISESAMNFTNAITTYATNGLYEVIPFTDYLVNIWKYDVTLAETVSKGFSKEKFEALQASLTKTKGIQKPSNTLGETEDT